MTLRMLALSFGIVAVLAITYGIYVAYPIARAYAVAARLVDAAIPYEQHPSDSSLRVLVAGDSTGAGVGAASSSESVAGRLGQDLPDADITNISVSGFKLEDLERTLETHTGKYDLVVLQIGANDIIGGTSLDHVRESLRSVLNRAGELGTHTVVLTSGDVGLAPIFHFPLPGILHRRTLGVRSIFREEVSLHEDSIYVDLFKKPEDDPFSKDPDRYYAADHFHPSGDGYGVWYGEVKIALNESLLYLKNDR